MGWLEVLLDDAPHLVVTGFSDGNVPKSIESDALLPDGLRREMGLLHNGQRLARDVIGSTPSIGEPATGRC